MRHATVADYIKVQGGKPQIYFRDGLWHIVHRYRPDSPVVRTHRDPTTGELVALGIAGEDEVVLFESAKLWLFEGAPCERQSLLNGGHGYDRHYKNRQT